jgi:hypothetical protein
MVGTNQDLKNSIFSSIKEKGDSIPAKPPIKDSIENKIDSSQQDQDGPEDGINKGGTPRKNPPIEPPKVGPNSTSILSKGTIQFGSQQWMVGDLEVSKFRNGDPIYEAKSADEWQLAAKNRIPAWCFYDNDPNKGKLYN